MKNKKFVLIASFPGSILSFRGALITAIQKEGYEVHVIAPHMELELLNGLEVESVVVHQIELQRTGLNPLKDLASLFSIATLLNKIKPEKVLSYTIKPVIYGSIAAKLANVPSIYSLITGLGYAFTGEATGKRKIIQKVLHGMYKVALSTNKQVFFQNSDDKALFKKLGLSPKTLNPTVVNGSGVDVCSFSTAPFSDTCDFLLIARLLGDKGVREYAQAAKQLKLSHPQATCRLVGWIDDNPDAIKQTELDEWVDGGYIDFLGRKCDVKPAIEQCNVYVLPSYREGTPRTVLEAMAMGRPIITTDAPGCRETVKDGENGYLVPVQNSDAIYKCMVEFVENKELIIKMGAKSRQMAEQKFDVHNVNHKMLATMDML
ncbi:glycosyltransferase family 4 protein [Vibrio sp. 10N.261.51.F12]|uniref:glycosyltransferase family 4 protein n=1 Tax=Vibrio sp. 10N.261.51.F12 TaxID=3229679 RepID=UPI00354F8C51